MPKIEFMGFSPELEKALKKKLAQELKGLERECAICAAYGITSKGVEEILFDRTRDGARLRRVYGCRACIREGATTIAEHVRKSRKRKGTRA